MDGLVTSAGDTSLNLPQHGYHSIVAPCVTVTALPERDAEGYGGPRLVGTIGIGGTGWSVYDGSGPAAAMKTWDNSRNANYGPYLQIPLWARILLRFALNAHI